MKLGTALVLRLLSLPALSLSMAAQRPPELPDGRDRGDTLASTSARLTRDLRMNRRAVVPEVRFDGAHDTLVASSDYAIRELARVLVTLPGDFLIEAHTASSGNPGVDLLRSDRRAAAVKSRLVHYGFPSARLVTMGYGATKRPQSLPNGRPAPEDRIEVSRIP